MSFQTDLGIWSFIMVILAMTIHGFPAEASHDWFVYVGTYTGDKSEGIYLAHFDSTSGQLDNVRLVAKAENPSFLAIHPNRQFLYAVNEMIPEQPHGMVSSYSIDTKTGDLTYLNSQPTRGGAPCHLVVDATGKFVLVANYNGGSTIVFPIDADGRLGDYSGFSQHQGSSVNRVRQEGPHAHSVNLDAANRFAFVADLGLDKILVFRFDQDRGTIVPHDPPSVSVKPGAGPRHFAFHPNGGFAYLINELDMTVDAFTYDVAKGILSPIQTISTIPGDYEKGMSTADIHVASSGKFVYGSNRGHHSIVAYKVDPSSGKLTYVENELTQGKTPRNFSLDPSGKYLLAENQDSHTIAVFEIDQESGALEPTGTIVDVPKPVCVQFLSVGD